MTFDCGSDCLDHQRESVSKLSARDMTADQNHRTIRSKCAKDWPDDLPMRNFCEERGHA